MALIGGLLIGIFFGVINAKYYPIDFAPTLSLFLWLIAAVVVTVVLHEGVHGMVAQVLGNRPIYGLKLPLVFITFNDKIPRDHFIVIALAPLVILDIVFGLFFFRDIMKTFTYFAFFINTLGAMGDVWIALKLFPHERGTLVQDTKTGVEVWKV